MMAPWPNHQNGRINGRGERQHSDPAVGNSLAEIGFYHLVRTGVVDALPPLLGKTLAAGQRALVCAHDRELLEALDNRLWLCENPDWLPHGMAGGAFAADQPILLSCSDSAENGARFLFLLDGMEVDAQRFERVFDLFDGKDEQAVSAARMRWSRAKSSGHSLIYWQQGERGWVRAG